MDVDIEDGGETDDLEVLCSRPSFFFISCIISPFFLAGFFGILEDCCKVSRL